MLTKFRLAVMCAVCCLVFAIPGFILGSLFSLGFLGLFFGVLLGAAYWFFGICASEQFVLDIYDARLVDSLTSPNLYSTLRKLSKEAGIEPPLIYSIPYQRPNAFAISRVDRSAIIVMTQGLMGKLDPDEVRAILALMVARIAASDSATWSVAVTLAGVPISILTCAAFRDAVRSHFQTDATTGMTALEKALLSVIVPICALGLRLNLDRAALTQADFSAARIAGSPSVLASALAKIEAGCPNDWWGNLPFNPATAMLFAVPPMAFPKTLADEAANPFVVRMQTAFVSALPTVDERRARLLGRVDKAGVVPA